MQLHLYGNKLPNSAGNLTTSSLRALSISASCNSVVGRRTYFHSFRLAFAKPALSKQTRRDKPISGFPYKILRRNKFYSKAQYFGVGISSGSECMHDTHALADIAVSFDMLPPSNVRSPTQQHRRRVDSSSIVQST